MEMHSESTPTITKLELYQIAVSDGCGTERCSRPLMIVLKIASRGAMGWGKLILPQAAPNFDLIHWSRQLEQLKGKSPAAANELLLKMQGTWNDDKIRLAQLALTDLVALPDRRFCPQELALILESQAYYGSV
ncbi:hypothetical protein [Paenibacillus apiarius]|uniref:hypothetical protein n=1 Tax=Paenibacillus apiarius TaxID=46240 RepID=UPI00197F8CC8|nr:hypothetical protein [Paenibacillus apiarius]MBN3525803.1 hypothetical protein [Paenibacillus apiarius]